MLTNRRTLYLILALLVVVTAACYGATVLKRFDKIAVGPTTFSTGLVNLAPGTTAAAGVYFGNDVTLYRSAANALKTDDALTVAGAVAGNGNWTIGDASTDVATCTGRLVIRQVTDAGPMTATPGTKGEIVYNLSNDKVYVCTVTQATAATWGALN